MYFIYWISNISGERTEGKKFGLIVCSTKQEVEDKAVAKIIEGCDVRIFSGNEIQFRIELVPV
jgi:hypothetical protein